MKNFFLENTIAKYGTLLGLYFVLQAIVLFNLGMYFDQGTIPSILSLIITTGVIFLSIKEQKGKIEELQIVNALKTGITVAFVAGVVYIAYSLLFVYSIEPGIIEESVAITRTKLEAQGMAEEDIAKSVEMTREAFIPSMILGILLFNVFIGFIISLISGIILKPKQ